MLVLTRSVGESLHIGDAVTVKIMRVQGGQVRIGIKAPKSIVICRKEIRKNNLAELLRQ